MPRSVVDESPDRAAGVRLMDFTALKVNPITCGKCGSQIDTADAEPLSSVRCPKCSAAMPVPVEIGGIMLFRVLGEGSSGTVYHGLDKELRRNIAVKILHDPEPRPTGVGSSARTGPDAVLAEARAMAAVNHPNVVKIHTIGEFGDRHFIAMELLAGGKVQQMIDKRGRLSERRSLRVTLDAARGLAAALAVGLRHQDVKPDNILLDDEGNAKLLDFGFARFGRKTRTQTIIGTPAYVAPEIIRQEDADFRADIYSLGCTLYHMLTGHTPFGGDTASGAYKAHLDKTATYLRDENPTIHTETADVVAWMLQREPEDRPASYEQLIGALEHAVEAVQAGPQDADEPTIDLALRAAAEAARSTGPRRNMPSPKPQAGQSPARPASARSSRRTHPVPKPEPGAATASRSARKRPSPAARKKKKDSTVVLMVILAIVGVALLGLIILLFTLIMSSKKEGDEDTLRPAPPPALAVDHTHTRSDGLGPLPLS